MNTLAPDAPATDHSVRLRAEEAANYLRVSSSTLAKWRMRREGPPYERCGSRVILYDRAELDAWLARRRVRPKSDYRDGRAS
jgi:excisionase family DNA binding protein